MEEALREERKANGQTVIGMQELKDTDPRLDFRHF
jgi:hypothetical protein